MFPSIYKTFLFAVISPLIYTPSFELLISPFTCKARSVVVIDLTVIPSPLLTETSPTLMPYVLPITLPETVIPLPLEPLQSISPLTDMPLPATVLIPPNTSTTP